MKKSAAYYTSMHTIHNQLRYFWFLSNATLYMSLHAVNECVMKVLPIHQCILYTTDYGILVYNVIHVS